MSLLLLWHLEPSFNVRARNKSCLGRSIEGFIGTMSSRDCIYLIWTLLQNGTMHCRWSWLRKSQMTSIGLLWLMNFFPLCTDQVHHAEAFNFPFHMRLRHFQRMIFLHLPFERCAPTFLTRIEAPRFPTYFKALKIPPLFWRPLIIPTAFKRTRTVMKELTKRREK